MTSKKVKLQISADFKKMFGDKYAWFMTDADYCEDISKIQWFVRCGKGTIGILWCEDRREKYDLDYENNYWGSKEFNCLMEKYGLSMEWCNSCIACIYKE